MPGMADQQNTIQKRSDGKQSEQDKGNFYTQNVNDEPSHHPYKPLRSRPRSAAASLPRCAGNRRRGLIAHQMEQVLIEAESAASRWC
jgi:hypothetical protein